MSGSSNAKGEFTQDTSYFEDQDLKILSKFALRIQLAATGIATSFLLLFVPNVETITLLAFFFGFLFPARYALSITFTMVIGWEFLLTMVISFSGLTFFFKLLAWTLITLIGSFARKLKINKAYEFAIFGFISSLLFDIIVTISIPLVFITDDGSFISVLIASFIFGIPFTIAHVVSNSVLFSFFPKILQSLLPILENRYSDLIKIRSNYFHNNNSKRFSILLIFMITFPLIGIASYSYFTTSNENQNEIYSVSLLIDYGGVREDEIYFLEVTGTMTFLEVTQSVANVGVTYKWGPPYVESINDVTEKIDLANHFWIYYIDSTRALFNVGTSLGTSDITNSSIILWNYEAASL